MLSKGSILVVDDEVNLCRILGAKLTKNGYSVVTVHDGLQAVERIRETEFDVILLDLILPKMDGLAALAEIRGMNRGTPVIIMSACENIDTVEQAMNSGACAYVKKPFDLDSLVTLVQDTSENASAPAERRSAASSLLFAKNQTVTLDVRNHEGSRTFLTSIEDKDDRSLSVIAPTLSNGTVEISLNTPVRVGLAHGDAHYSFNSFVIARKHNGRPLLVLDKPGAIYRTQRRRSPRKQLRAEARYCSAAGGGAEAESMRKALTLDISSGGICLALDESLSPGQLVYLEVDSPERTGRLSATAEVMHRRDSTEPNTPRYIVGLRFSKIDDTSRQALLIAN